MPRLTDDEYIQRVKMGFRWMQKFASLDTEVCQRFRDASLTGQQIGGYENENDEDGPDVMQQVAVGDPNLFRTLEYAKLAATTIRNPDFKAKSENPQASLMARNVFRRLWKQNGWNRVGQKCFLKYAILGLGLVCYYWDRERHNARFEQVQSWDLCIDPLMTDWQQLEWGGRRITMSLRKAIARYPEYYTKSEQVDPFDRAGSGRLDKKKVRVWVYWDEEVELHLLDTDWRILRKDENRYGKVPFLIMQSLIDPGPSVFPLGDGILAAGEVQEYMDHTLAISHTAKHGTPVNVYETGQFDKGAQDALKEGKQQGYIGVKDLTRAPILRLPGEQVTEAQLLAQREAKEAVQEITAVTAGMLGTLIPNVTATQTAYTEQKSSARAQQCVTDFQIFLDSWAEALHFLLVEFGGPQGVGNGSRASTPQEVAEWELLRQVQEILVVESSTLYRDPATDQQQSLQLYQVDVNSMSTFVNLKMIGLLDELPNLIESRNRMLRAFGINNLDDEWEKEAQMQVPGQGGAPGGGRGKPPIENINYKDAPEDIKRQMEAQAGLQPSQVGSAPPVPPTDNSLTPEQQFAMEGVRQQHERQLAGMQQLHQMALESMKQQHAGEIERLRLAHQT